MQDREPAAGSIISRREAVRRTMILLGGAISAPTLAGVLAGCERARAGAAWRPVTLTDGRDELIATIAEHIIPTTDTPGARAAGVHEFIDEMLTEYYPEEARRRFLAGIQRLEDRSSQRHGRAFLDLSQEDQLAMVAELNGLAFDDPPPDLVVRPREPAIHQQHEETGRIRDEAQVPADTDGTADVWDPDDVGQEAFFRMLKELVVVGYYTSEIGATEELRLMPMGVYRSDVPYDEIGRAWV